MDHIKTPSAFQQLQQTLQEYRLQKALRMQATPLSPEHARQECQAKEALFELDQEHDITKNSEQDFYVDRWSNYKVPEKVEERISLRRSKKQIGSTQVQRYLQQYERSSLPSVSRSQKTIPKLKVMLHQLQCPLNLSSSRKSDKTNGSAGYSKLKTHIGVQALVISNKQQIKPSVRSERKTMGSLAIDTQGQNKRPPSSNLSFKGQPASSHYQKIKRTFGNQHEPQKQVLSQLLKSNPGGIKSEGKGPLSNMLNYFTMNSDPKKKITSKLGLDRLLS